MVVVGAWIGFAPRACRGLALARTPAAFEPALDLERCWRAPLRWSFALGTESLDAKIDRGATGADHVLGEAIGPISVLITAQGGAADRTFTRGFQNCVGLAFGLPSADTKAMARVRCWPPATSVRGPLSSHDRIGERFAEQCATLDRLFALGADHEPRPASTRWCAAMPLSPLTSPSSGGAMRQASRCGFQKF